MFYYKTIYLNKDIDNLNVLDGMVDGFVVFQTIAFLV